MNPSKIQQSASLTTQPANITLWHGSRKWVGCPEIQPSRKGRAEHGPGIYVTTHLETAQQYAKGGGAVRKIVLNPRLILEHAALSLSDACDFVTTVIAKSRQADVIDRLVGCASRHNLEDRILLGQDTQRFHAESLVALCVNGDLTPGAKGQALAEFLSGQGIDCSFSRRTGKEYWGVVFNPDVILGYEKVLAKDVPDFLQELPDPALQRADANWLAKLKPTLEAPELQ